MKRTIKVKLTGEFWGNRGEIVDVIVNSLVLPDGLTFGCTSDPVKWSNGGYEIEIVDDEKPKNDAHVISLHTLLGQDVKTIEFK